MKKWLYMLFLILVSGVQSNVFAAETFKNTNGVFKKDAGENGNECVLYVRYETEILWKGCHTLAYHSCPVKNPTTMPVLTVL